MSETKEFHVLVAGGGIGGLALAQYLHKAGVSVAVYERDRHRTARLQGFRIHISPHGSAALHECLPPDLFDAFVATSGRRGQDFTFATEQLRELLSLSDEVTGRDTTRERSHYGASRITLRQILLSGLDGVVHFDKQFDRYERRPDGRITAHFADGTSATGDLLIGADGGNSRVRAQYLPQAQRVDTGIVAIAGKYALTEDSRARLDPILHRGPVSIMPPKDCSMFCAPHLLDTDIALPEGIGGNDTADPGALFDNTYSYELWAFAARRETYPVDPLTRDPQQLHELVQQLIATWSPTLRRMVAESDAETVTVLPVHTATPVQPWETSTVTLLGDAIHSMTPFRGIGANTALRDAQLLGRTIIAAHHGTAPLLAGIAEYEAAMLDYGFAAVRSSLKAAQQAVAPSRAARGLAKTVFRGVNAVPALKRLAFADHGDS